LGMGALVDVDFEVIWSRFSNKNWVERAGWRRFGEFDFAV